jgi:hypothetical protein
VRGPRTKVYYCLGLARNSRLPELLEVKFARVRDVGHFVWRGGAVLQSSNIKPSKVGLSVAE